MNLKLYQVDAFADRIFSGNPAAVCPLDQWLEDGIMQSIAMENNLSETAFFVKSGNSYEIRWFTPTVEVNLCGHATLASAFVLFSEIEPDKVEIDFFSPRSGELKVRKDGDLLTLNFPSDHLSETPLTPELYRGLNLKPIKALKGRTDLLLVYEKEAQIRGLIPDFTEIAKIDARGVIVTAPGDEVDFVSRFFAPKVGVNEDPVTGSAHTSLTPYWSAVLGKPRLSARQLSKRGGSLICEQKGERVEISGRCVMYLRGEIAI